MCEAAAAGLYDRWGVTSDRLRTLDAAFLSLERRNLPMNVGALALFDGAELHDSQGRFRLDDLRALVDARVASVPRLRRRVAPVPLQLGRPVWVDDPGFDVAHHVRAVSLPVDGRTERAALLELAADLHATPLPRDRPLWDLCFVDGLSEGRVALVQRVHHALADGMGTVAIADLVLDPTPRPTGGPSAMSAPPADEPTPPPEPAVLVADSVREWWEGGAGAARDAARLARDPRDAMRRATALAGAVGSFLGSRSVAPRLSLQATVGPRRRLETARLPRAVAKSVSRVTGANVNEVVLATIAGGVARLLAARGELTDDLVLNVASPVSTRSGGERASLGNHVSMIVVPVPVGVTDPLARLTAVQRAVHARRRGGQARATTAFLDAGDVLPASIFGAAVQVAHGQRFANLVVSSVPGPRVPRFCLGARLMEAAPVVPLARNLNISVAVLSYCDQLGVGVLADPDVAPDLDVLLDGIHESYDALARAAGPDGGSTRRA